VPQNTRSLKEEKVLLKHLKKFLAIYLISKLTAEEQTSTCKSFHNYSYIYLYTQLKTYPHYLHKTFIVLTHISHPLQYSVITLDSIDIAHYGFVKRYSL